MDNWSIKSWNDSKSLDGNSDKEFVRKVKYSKIITEKVNHFMQIIKDELTEGEQLRIITNKSFNAVSVLQYIEQIYSIEEMYIVVYRMNDLSFDYLSEIINRNNIKTSFVISIFFRNNKRYERWAHELKSISKYKSNISVKFVNSHAKIFLAKTKCNKHIVFEGSGNLSHNERIEQYLYENNREIYNFHKEWIDQL